MSVPTPAAGDARGDVDVAGVAALIGEPARARILLALCAGDARSAADLAREARLSAPATSAHLGKLLAAGLVTVTRAGRHRWYRIGGRDVAAALEALARLAPTETVRSLRQDGRARALHDARICFDHLAGRLGVLVADGLVGRGAVVAAEPDALGDVTWTVGGPAVPVFAQLGLSSDLVVPGAPLHACLDWSVGRPHLSGAVGAALLRSMVAARWVRRVPEQRAVRLTEDGRLALRAVLGTDPGRATTPAPVGTGVVGG